MNLSLELKTKARYNIVIVGKTGVGKSTLINYLYGQNIREAGTGKPVTQNGFHPIEFKIKNLPVTIFDSWGLEVGKYKEWMKELDNELKNRGTDKSAENWFHTIFYCIASSGHRVEDCDIDIIKKLIENKYKVSVIFTKSDSITDEEAEKLKSSIQNEIKDINTIFVNSESKKLMNGNVMSAFGKEEVEKQAYKDFWDSIILRLPERCLKLLNKRVEEWKYDQEKYINSKITALGWNSEDIKKDLDSAFKKIQLEINSGNIISNEIEYTLRLYSIFYENISKSSASYEFFNKKLNFNDSNDSDNFKWWHIPVMIPFIPVALIYGIINGKKDAIKDLNKLLTENTNSLLSEIKKCEKSIKNFLSELKEQKLS